MALSEDEEFELLSLEREKAQFAPKRQFNTIAEAQAAMQEAQVNQRNAEYGVTPLGMIDRGIGTILNPATQTVLGAARTMTGGLSNAYEKATGLGNQKDPYYRAGQLAGYIPVGMATTGAAAAMPLLAGRPIVQGMVSGAMAGGITTPENRAMGAGIGAALGGALPMASAIIKKFPKIINLGGRKTGQKVAELSDKGIDKVGDYLSKKYDVMFEKLRTVNGTRKPDSIINAIEDVKNQFPTQDMGKLAEIQKRLLKIQKAGKELTGEELHNLKQEVRTLIPKSVWKGSSEADAMQAAKKDIYFRVNEELGALGGEEYKALGKEFKQFKDAEALTRKLLYQDNVVSNQNLMRQLDVPKENALKYLNSQIPNKEDQFLDALMAYRRGQNIKKAAAFGLPVAGGIGAAYNALSGR